MPTETELRDFKSSVLADRLGIIAMVLFFLYGVKALAAMVPIQPLDTLWQLKAISTLIDSAAIPLVGLALLHLAAYLDPANSALAKRRDQLARLAILAVIGFLLLIPGQALASWSTVATARARVTTQLTSANRSFALVREAISAATSLDDLQTRLQSLQSAELGIRFENLGLPLSETKRQMLLRLNEVEEQVKTKINAPPPEAIEDVASNAGRLMGTSLVYALAFAMAAQRRSQEIPLLVEILTIWSLRNQAGRRPRGIAGAPDGDYFAQLAPPDQDPADAP